MKTQLDEFNLMKASDKRTIETPIANGKTIKWLNCWDYKDTLNQVSFKTTTPPPYKHEKIQVESLDLMPSANVTIYEVTVKRF
jgi:hypothetical protein